MRKLVHLIAAFGFIAGVLLSTAIPASAATPADKPVVTVGTPQVWASGGVTPDSWRQYVRVPVGGFNFTPGGNVYITFQDITAGSPALPNGEWTVAGSGPCGPECNNFGRIAYARTLNYAYGSICGHTIRVWAWDQVKSPRADYGWSFRDTQVAC